MNKILLISIIALSINACNYKNHKEDINPDTVKDQVNTILNDWHKDAAKTNFDQYFNAMDNNSFYIGTDALENWSKKEFQKFCKPFFDKGKAWNFKTLERRIFVSNTGDVVWFNELLDTWMGICRGSGILEKSENKWKIKQYVLSISIPNDCTREVIRTKSVKDSIYLKELKESLKD